MGDMLIRNVPETARADLAELAKRQGKSISETTKSALMHGIDALRKLGPEHAAIPMGTRLQQIFAGVFDTDDEAKEFGRILEEVRQGPERPLPDFK